MNYNAPIKDMLFVINELADLPGLSQLPALQDTSPELTQAVLTEAAKFSHEILAPLNKVGDRHPCTWKEGAVTTAPGFKEAFAQFCAAGWQGVVHPQDAGGQGLPKLIATACTEIFNAANLSLSLCSLLNDGVIEALLTVGTPAQQQRYIPNLLSGKWTGTMDLTEPQAGSDLALIRTQAKPQANGQYKIFGTKIFISYGEHDMAENIIHLVLARTPNAPPGVKGISLFLVPKFLLNDDGSVGARNDVHCVALEHKLGIHASPTAALQFGDHGGALGELVGSENRGLECMFILMNMARFSVGLQGIGVAERAYQKAVTYAKERVQGCDLSGTPGAVPIIHHPDIKRMLMTMRALTEGARAMAYIVAAAYDRARHDSDEQIRKEQRAFYELMIPVVKGYSTEKAIEITSLALQVHGGMGFIEETGVAQYYRDARITSIYEGTTAIQANDLVNRKTLHDGGAAVRALCERIAHTEHLLKQRGDDCQAVAVALSRGRESIERVLHFVLMHIKSDTKAVFAGSVPYLLLLGLVTSAWQLGRAMMVAQDKFAQDPVFYGAKITTAQFFSQTILCHATSLADAITHGGVTANALSVEQF